MGNGKKRGLGGPGIGLYYWIHFESNVTWTRVHLKLVVKLKTKIVPQINKTYQYRPFLSYSAKTFIWKWFRMHENETVGRTQFHMDGYTWSLILTERRKAIWKWPIVVRCLHQCPGWKISDADCTVASIHTVSKLNFIVTFPFSGFKEYLETAPTYDFPQYRQLVHDITQTFNNISNEVIGIEVKLRENGQTNIGDIIRKIQLKEKEKLEMVSYLQLKENYMFIMYSLLGPASS